MKGRPKKAGARYPSGGLRPAQQPETPAARLDEFELRHVTEGGQVVAQAYKRRNPMDAIACNAGSESVDGDQWRALLAYANANHACKVSARSALDMSPSGGGGMEAIIDARRYASEHFEALRASLPAHLVGLVDMVCVQGHHPRDLAHSFGVKLSVVYAKLGQAADCLMVAIPRRKAA